MNIAILIGVSKYNSEAPLPACAYDVENMHRLLSATKKYEDIQCISDQTNSSQLKDALREFFAKYQNSSDISEALIYFSGHGVYQNDALLCCSDFDSNRPSTTSISNEELDDLLRSIEPDVAVKIIDACQSGSPYIKDASAGFEKALRKSQLKSFICMASSRQDQSSYASANESHFTAHWIDAALTKQKGDLLYRDIQAALADAFVANPGQTPFFVIQGTGLEVFTTITEDMRTLAANRSKSTISQQPYESIATLVKAEISKLDAQYVPHNDVIQAVEKSKKMLSTLIISDTLVSKFYEKSVTTDSKLANIPKSSAVAQFAEEQSWSKKYFAKINTERYTVRVLKDRSLVNLFSAAYQINGKRDDSDYVDEARVRPSSLESTESLPFEVAELLYTSKHPSLKAFYIYIGIVHSRTEIMVLSSTVRLVQKGWSERTPELSELQWRYQNYTWISIVQDPSTLWQDAIARGESDIRAYLESMIPKTESSSPDIETPAM